MSRAYDNAWTVIVLRFYVLTSFPVHYDLMSSILKKTRMKQANKPRTTLSLRRSFHHPPKKLRRWMYTLSKSRYRKHTRREKSCYRNLVNFIRFVAKCVRITVYFTCSIFFRTRIIHTKWFLFRYFALNRIIFLGWQSIVIYQPPHRWLRQVYALLGNPS